MLASREAQVAGRKICAIESLRLLLLAGLGAIGVDALFVRAVSFVIRIVHVDVTVLLWRFRGPRVVYRVTAMCGGRRSDLLVVGGRGTVKRRSCWRLRIVWLILE